MTKNAEQSTLINLETNISLCLTSGYKTLIWAKDEVDYRNAICNIHNGVELLMKYYLKEKNQFIIYDKIDHELLLYGNKDLIKVIKKVYPPNTIKWFNCIDLLGYFSKLPGQYLGELKKLNGLSNSRKHFEYYSTNKDSKKLLIAYVYPFIKGLLSELNLNVIDFIKKDYVVSTLEKYKANIDNDVMHKLIEKIARAKNHYFEELTEEERIQKTATQDYRIIKKDKLILCPACKKDALLSRSLSLMQEDAETSSVIKRKIIISQFSCHHCGLNITNYDQLKYEFKEEEEVLSDVLVGQFLETFRAHPDDNCDCPNDCDDDCDCPSDCDNDCPMDCDDDCDCPSDCDDDCPMDCDDDCDCPMG